MADVKSRHHRESAELSGEIFAAYRSDYSISHTQLKPVMAGLDPAIHVRAGEPVDARVEPGHDEFWLDFCWMPNNPVHFPAKAGVTDFSEAAADG